MYRITKYLKIKSVFIRTSYKIIESLENYRNLSSDFRKSNSDKSHYTRVNLAIKMFLSSFDECLCGGDLHQRYHVECGWTIQCGAKREAKANFRN